MEDVKFKDCSIQIDAAANGFVVRVPYDLSRDRAGSISESHVFRTMKELLKFVSDNFTHRDEVKLNDRV